MYDEPYCYCEMLRRNLPLNETARSETDKKMRKAFNEIFGIGDEKDGLQP
jgi:hypothetical protein